MKPRQDPIPYQLLLLQAIDSFIEIKQSLSPMNVSQDYLVDCWGALVAWSNGKPAPSENTIAHPAADAWVVSIVAMRRSPAARYDADDDGLDWLIDLCELLNVIIARPGHWLELEQENMDGI